ncbi:unnamed protein product [Blepharisma stoltei]|uniref:Glutaredoxin domain-containing protein n=1 Tax=Blepharisma stoltei TaxID=1481888 RepID=A0AAU9J859_9CILI|nr:unnamed protein product [Blepharisma stoltei]
MGSSQSPSNCRPEVEEIIRRHKCVVFSATYCPYCDRAKTVLGKMKVSPLVIELDQHPRGKDYRQALKEITNQTTVPNIFIGEAHIGGCSDLIAGIKKGTVQQHFSRAGVEYHDVVNEI